MKLPEPGTLGKWSIKLTLASVLVAVGVLIIILYFYFPQHREDLRFISATLAGLAAIYSAYYVGIGLRMRIDHDIITHSFMLLDRYHNLELVKYRTNIQKLFDSDQLPSLDITDKIKSDTELQIAVKATLNIFEHVSIAAQRGYADEVTLYDDLCVYLPWLLRNMNPYINYLRTRYNDCRLYCESDKLAGCWAAGNFISTGKKIPRVLNV